MFGRLPRSTTTFKRRGLWSVDCNSLYETQIIEAIPLPMDGSFWKTDLANLAIAGHATSANTADGNRRKCFAILKIPHCIAAGNARPLLNRKIFWHSSIKSLDLAMQEGLVNQDLLELMESAALEEAEEYMLLLEEYIEENGEDALSKFGDTVATSSLNEAVEQDLAEYLEILTGGWVNLNVYQLIFNKRKFDLYMKSNIIRKIREWLAFIRLFFSFLIFQQKDRLNIDNRNHLLRTLDIAESCLGPYRRRTFPPLTPMAPPALN